MGNFQGIKNMDRRLRLLLLATFLLIAPQIGQFVAIRDLNVHHTVSAVAILLELIAIFFVPTSVTLTGVIAYICKPTWNKQPAVFALCIVNILLAISITLYLVAPCTWSALVSLPLHGCAK